MWYHMQIYCVIIKNFRWKYFALSERRCDSAFVVHLKFDLILLFILTGSALGQCGRWQDWGRCFIIYLNFWFFFLRCTLCKTSSRFWWKVPGLLHSGLDIAISATCGQIPLFEEEPGSGSWGGQLRLLNYIHSVRIKICIAFTVIDIKLMLYLIPINIANANGISC